MNENTIHLRSKDHPEANGRTPQPGEHGYTIIVPLEGGHDLRLSMGQESMTRFADMIGRMTIDDAAEAQCAG